MTKLKERFRLSGEIEVEQWCDGNGNLGPCSCGDGPPSKGHWRLARTVTLDDVLEAARKQWDEETPAQWQDCTECAEKAKRAEKERDEARADLQNLRDILLSQIPLTKEPGTNVELLRQLVQQRDSARAKAIQFDLDRAGIEQRAAEAAELVDLRAEVERLRAELEGEWLTRSKRLEEDGAKLLAGLAASSLARLRAVAERQREACAAQFDTGPERKRMWASLVRKTLLVTEEK